MGHVVIENLVKNYVDKDGAEIRAVNQINLSIEDGEFMVLVGPSGCGKTTTLRMIAGLEEISSGDIWIDGQRVNQVLPKDRDIAMVFQNYALYPHMSVYENMAFGLKLRRFPAIEIKQRVNEAASMLGLEPYLDRRPRALSGGQRQRVAVGRAIVRKPKIFLFDEPLSNLDAKMRGTTRTEISKLHARLGTTMIYVTHDQVEAMTMSDRMCVMKNGDIMQVADPLTIYNKPSNRFVASFIGSPPMNFFPGSIQAGRGELLFVEKGEGPKRLVLPLPAQIAQKMANRLGSCLVLGLRPEHIHLSPTIISPRPDSTAEVTVEISEPMGFETFLHLRTDSTPFIARVSATQRYMPNQPITVAFDLAHALFFDEKTEAILD